MATEPLKVSVGIRDNIQWKLKALALFMKILNMVELPSVTPSNGKIRLKATAYLKIEEEI